MTLAHLAAALPLEELPEPVVPLDDEHVRPGLLGFAVVIALALVTWLLVRSMLTHVRRITPPTAPQAAPQAAPRSSQAAPSDAVERGE